MVMWLPGRCDSVHRITGEYSTTYNRPGKKSKFKKMLGMVSFVCLLFSQHCKVWKAVTQPIIKLGAVWIGIFCMFWDDTCHCYIHDIPAHRYTVYRIRGRRDVLWAAHTMYKSFQPTHGWKHIFPIPVNRAQNFKHRRVIYVC